MTYTMAVEETKKLVQKLFGVEDNKIINSERGKTVFKWRELTLIAEINSIDKALTVLNTSNNEELFRCYFNREDPNDYMFLNLSSYYNNTIDFLS